MDKLTLEQWNELAVEEQERMLEEEPEAVPDDATSVAEQETSQQEKPGKKEPPLENLIGEAVRKETKKIKEEYEERIRELESRNQSQSQSSGDYWQKESERLELAGIVKSAEELREEAQRTANVVIQMKQLEKMRKKEIKDQMKTISESDRKLFGEDIEEELENYPENNPLPANAVERALIFAKGKNADKLVEAAKKNLEKEMGKRKIEGEATDETTFIPEGGETFTTSNKTPTATQKRLALQRGISVDRQIWLDEKAEARKKGKK